MKVYAFCNSGSGTDMQTWFAIAENGQVVTTHWSSSREWGIHDVGPEWKKEAYAKALGEDIDIEYIVLDDGAVPPADVLERNAEIGRQAVADEEKKA